MTPSPAETQPGPTQPGPPASSCPVDVPRPKCCHFLAPGTLRRSRSGQLVAAREGLSRPGSLHERIDHAARFPVLVLDPPAPTPAAAPRREATPPPGSPRAAHDSLDHHL